MSLGVYSAIGRALTLWSMDKLALCADLGLGVWYGLCCDASVCLCG